MRAAILLLILALAVPASADGNNWRMLQAPHYTVLSQLDDGDTVAWARDYDQFIASITTTLSINPKSLPPLTVVLFAKDKDFEHYKLVRPDGSAAKVAGQFLRQPSFSLIAMAGDGENAETRRIIYHEATHWLMSVDPRRQPAWFTEGIAEMFSTFERKIDTVNWGKPIEGHLYTLNNAPLIPFDEFLTQRSSLYDNEARTGRFYAQSWAFVHFLLLSSDPARRAKLLEYVRVYAGSTAETAMQQVFGDDLSVWERALTTYLRQHSYGYVKQPIQGVPQLPAPSDASPTRVEATLGLLALGTDRMDLAREHAGRALALDEQQPWAHELLAYIAQDGEDTAGMGRHAQDAVQRGSKDPEMYLILGDSYASGPNSELKDAAMKRVHAYENALNLSPLSYPAYERLMLALPEIENPTSEDAKFLTLGLKVYPNDDWLRVGVALLTAQRGQLAEAGELMDTALREGSSLDGSQRNYALGRRRIWSMQALNEPVGEALRKQDFDTARRLIEAEQRRLAGDAEGEQMLASMLASVTYSGELAHIRQQISGGRKAEARAALDRLLGKQDLAPELRQDATQLRARLQ